MKKQGDPRYSTSAEQVLQQENMKKARGIHSLRLGRRRASPLQTSLQSEPLARARFGGWRLFVYVCAHACLRLCLCGGPYEWRN